MPAHAAVGRILKLAVKVHPRQGWSVQAALHNHNFHPLDVRMNGAIASSLADA